jgi:rod shape-determining protein MreC
VLVGGGSGPRGALRVDKGSLAGVAEGAVVSVPEGLVGRVVSVTPHTCEILLVTDPSLKVACEVALPGGDFLRGTLAGGSDERLALRHILSKAEVPPRSPVFTSGLGGVFPKGIAVGTLLEVRQDRDSPRREGEVLPAVDFSTLKDVFIRRER